MSLRRRESGAAYGLLPAREEHTLVSGPGSVNSTIRPRESEEVPIVLDGRPAHMDTFPSPLIPQPSDTGESSRSMPEASNEPSTGLSADQPDSSMSGNHEPLHGLWPSHPWFEGANETSHAGADAGAREATEADSIIRTQPPLDTVSSPPTVQTTVSSDSSHRSLEARPRHRRRRSRRRRRLEAANETPPADGGAQALMAMVEAGRRRRTILDIPPTSQTTAPSDSSSSTYGDIPSRLSGRSYEAPLRHRRRRSAINPMFRRSNLSTLPGAAMSGEPAGNLVLAEEATEADLIIRCSTCRDSVATHGRAYLFERCGCVS